MRDSHPTPPHAPPGPSADGPGMGWGGAGGNPLWAYFHIGYRILDIHIYISKFSLASASTSAFAFALDYLRAALRTYIGGLGG